MVPFLCITSEEILFEIFDKSNLSTKYIGFLHVSFGIILGERKTEESAITMSHGTF